MAHLARASISGRGSLSGMRRPLGVLLPLPCSRAIAQKEDVNPPNGVCILCGRSLDVSVGAGFRSAAEDVEDPALRLARQ